MGVEFIGNPYEEEYTEGDEIVIENNDLDILIMVQQTQGELRNAIGLNENINNALEDSVITDSDDSDFDPNDADDYLYDSDSDVDFIDENIDSSDESENEQEEVTPPVNTEES